MQHLYNEYKCEEQEYDYYALLLYDIYAVRDRLRKRGYYIKFKFIG